MIIAIDGPAGSGKSSVAKILAKKLNYRHIDTGSMYRAVAWKSLGQGIDLSHEEPVVAVAANMDIELVPHENGQRVRVDGQDVTAHLYNEEVGRGAASVACLARVRDMLVAKQRNIGRNGSVVMDGRDIGTVVFPAAEKKFFLDASPEARGKRRYLELKEQGKDVDLDSIVEQVKQRDHEDRTRKVSPLIPAQDAIELDTTEMDLNGVVEKLLQWIQKE